MPNRRNVLVVTADSLSPKMAGPAIRAFEIAKAVSKVANTKLTSTVHASLAHRDLEITDTSEGGLHALVGWADVIVFQGHTLASFPWIAQTDKIIVADIYDPMHLEQLEQSKGESFDRRVHGSLDTVGVLNDQIVRADFMVCASDKQRDFWLGQLAAMGRLNPATYDQDSTVRKLIDVVPFGVQDAPAVQKRHGIKGTIPGIAPDDKVILWGGGIYNWFDPLTLIRAVEALAGRRPEVKLFFLGVGHPNPSIPTMQMAHAARMLAEERGLLGTSVFFNEGWVPYDERADYLLDADIGVSTHLEHLETAFSFRTRILDYLWSSLPVVSTAGDTFAELIERHSLGRVVAPGDVGDLELALENLLFDEAEHSAVAARVAVFAESMKWQKVLTPLIEFCVSGQRAPDSASKVLSVTDTRIAILENRVEGLEHSRSWKMTAPMRTLATAVRRVITKGTSRRANSSLDAVDAFPPTRRED